MNEWISVNERLPKKNSKGINDAFEVLCFIPHPYDKGHTIKNVWWINSNFSGFPSGATKVTHWVPLPEPPE